MVAATEMAKGPHLRLVWLSENIDEVRGVLAELWAGYCWLWCSGELVRARRSNGNGGGPLRPLRKGEEKQETKCGARRLTGARWGLMWCATARRGLASQAGGDAWRTRGLQALNAVEYCSVDSEFQSEPDSDT